MQLLRSVRWAIRVLALIVLATLARGQSPAVGKLEFDVASVREDQSEGPQRSNFSLDSGYVFSMVGKEWSSSPTGGTFSASNLSLLSYISFAYKLTGTQFLSFRFKEYLGGSGNLPSWFNSKRFSIEAKAPPDTTKDQMRAMLRSLLEDRFHLVVRWETRQVAVLGLELAEPDKVGSHLRRHSAADSCGDSGADQAEGLPRVCGVIARLPPTVPGRLHFGGRDVSLALLAASFPTQTGLAMLRHPVIDQTGLTGTFDFDMEWLPDTPDGEAPATDAAGPTFQKALKDQLGLKMVPSKGPVEVLVVDRVELPTAN